MAVPKKKMSRSRTRQRKATWKVAAPTVATCPVCRGPVRPHTACPTCGTYKRRQVLEVE